MPRATKAAEKPKENQVAVEEEVAATEEQQQEDDDERGGGCVQPIVKLRALANLTAKDVTCLVANGYCTVESIAYAPKKALLAIKGAMSFIIEICFLV